MDPTIPKIGNSGGEAKALLRALPMANTLVAKETLQAAVGEGAARWRRKCQRERLHASHQILQHACVIVSRRRCATVIHGVSETEARGTATYTIYGVLTQTAAEHTSKDQASHAHG